MNCILKVLKNEIILENKIDTIAFGHYMNDMVEEYEKIFGFKP